MPFHKGTLFEIALALIAGWALLAMRSGYQSGDSLVYAQLAEAGGPAMFHSHHLIFAPILHVLSRACFAIWLRADVIAIAQVHNVIWAVVTLLSLYHIVASLTGSLCLALSTFALFFATEGFLTYATQAEVYVPGLGALAALSASLLAMHSRRMTSMRVVGMMLLLSLAILYHQTNVLFIIPLALYFGLARSRQMQSYSVIIGLSGVIVLAAYVAAYMWMTQSPSASGFLRFCFRYTFHPDPTWGSVRNLSVAGLTALADSQIWNLLLVPPRLLGWARLAALVMVAGAGWSIWRLRGRDHLTAERAFLLAWLATYYAFFLWWLPSEKEFFVVTLFPILLLAVLTLYDRADRRTPSFRNRLACIVLAASAVLLSIQQLPLAWNRHTDRGWAYQEAKEMAELGSDSFAFMTHYETLQNLRFYFGRRWTVSLPLLEFYGNLGLPANWASAIYRSCLVPLWQLEPLTTVAEYNGYSRPVEWLSFIEWLFGFEYGSDGEFGACREFEIVRGKSGQSYVVLGRTKQTVAGLGQVFSRLDEASATRNASGEGPFSEWIRSACAPGLCGPAFGFASSGASLANAGLGGPTNLVVKALFASGIEFRWESNWPDARGSRFERLLMASRTGRRFKRWGQAERLQGSGPARENSESPGGWPGLSLLAGNGAKSGISRRKACW